MAKGGNTWCKKLMHKRKVYILKHAIGNEVGVMTYCAKAKSATARNQERLTVNDKPALKGPSLEIKTPLPRIGEWKPRQWKSGAREVLRHR
jgi:hypothetical protein